MAATSPLAVTPSLASAINRNVLKVLPETSIAEVIRQMSAVEGNVCATSADDTSFDLADALAGDGASHRCGDEFIGASGRGASNRRASCAIVMAPNEESLAGVPHRVIGILTERDIVRLTATQTRDRQSLEKTPVSALMTTPVKTMEDSDFQDIFAVLFLFRRYRIRHLPVVDSHQQLLGVVTPASIRQVLRPANLLKMRRVGDVMSTEVVQAPANVPIMFLAQMMAEKRVSCVVIVDTVGAKAGVSIGDLSPCPPVGIITERDIVQFQALGLNLDSLLASAVMSTPLFLLDPKDSLWAAHEAMKSHKVRRLVVSWNWGQGLGIITQTSMLRVFDPIEMYGIIDSLQHTVQQLEEERQPKQPIKGTPSAANPPLRSVAEIAMAEVGSYPSPLNVRTNAQTDSRSLRSMAEPNEMADPSEGLVALLDQATDYIIAAQLPQLTATQRQQLSQATQLIQQVRASHFADESSATGSASK